MVSEDENLDEKSSDVLKIQCKRFHYSLNYVILTFLFNTFICHFVFFTFLLFKDFLSKRFVFILERARNSKDGSFFFYFVN